jgi:hypothetical protein
METVTTFVLLVADGEGVGVGVRLWDACDEAGVFVGACSFDAQPPNARTIDKNTEQETERLMVIAS